MFKVIGDTIGRILGTDKAINSIVENTSSMFDKLVYTSEEKADAAQHDITEARAMILDWLKTTNSQNLTRRLLALCITATWLLQYILVGVLSVCAIWIEVPMSLITEVGSTTQRNALLMSADILKESASNMTGAVTLILTFYFASPYIGSAVEGLTKGGKKLLDINQKNLTSVKAKPKDDAVG